MTGTWLAPYADGVQFPIARVRLGQLDDAPVMTADHEDLGAWLWWWTPVIGLAPTGLLAWLHSQIDNGAQTVSMVTAAEHLTIADPAMAVPHLDEALFVLAGNRLCFTAADGQTLTLVDPIWQPGHDANRAAVAAIFETEGSVIHALPDRPADVRTNSAHPGVGADAPDRRPGEPH